MWGFIGETADGHLGAKTQYLRLNFVDIFGWSNYR